MIVDCYTHFWESPEQVGIAESAQGKSPVLPLGMRSSGRGFNAGAERHWAACEPVDKAIVLGFESNYLEARIPNELVADYVQRYPDKLLGFAGIDASSPRDAIDSMRKAREELGMCGVSLAPSAQDVHPTASPAFKVYEVAAELDLPLLFHSGPNFSARCKLEYARPMLLDEVAREFPKLRMIISHLGYPWVAETLVLLAKHELVFADISWLLHQPWQAYQALLSAYQYGVIDKLLFGSGFPYTSAAYCIEALYSINGLVQGTNLPTIPREALRNIVERDTLRLLGIDNRNGRETPPGDRTLLDEDN